MPYRGPVNIRGTRNIVAHEVKLYVVLGPARGPITAARAYAGALCAATAGYLINEFSSAPLGIGLAIVGLLATMTALLRGGLKNGTAQAGEPSSRGHLQDSSRDDAGVDSCGNTEPAEHRRDWE